MFSKIRRLCSVFSRLDKFKKKLGIFFILHPIDNVFYKYINLIMELWNSRLKCYLALDYVLGLIIFDSSQ